MNSSGSRQTPVVDSCGHDKEKTNFLTDWAKKDPLDKIN